jgi:dolichol-phosphate mannosyltransferase
VDSFLPLPVISIVVPVYGAPESLVELSERLKNSLESIVSSFEVILVNDGSPDSSWEVIKSISTRDQRFIGIRLSRNFGQHSAIMAGLNASIGQWIVVMDCDLQDRPEEIPNLYHKALEGYQQVVAVRRNRQDSWSKRISSRLYVMSLSYLSGRPINAMVGNFGIYHRCVISIIYSMKEQGRTFGLLALCVGFDRYELEVEHAARPFGRSSYSFRSLVNLGLQGVISHSIKPLRLTVKLGLYLSLTSFAGGMWITLRHFLWSQSLIGWSSIMVSMLFMTGILIFSIGMAGLYIGQIIEEVKERPPFIIWESTDNRDSQQ